MDNIGKPVYLYRGKSLRFGIAIEKKQERNWNYYKVKWVDNEQHEEAINHMLKLRSDEYDASFEWYRTDKINFFNPKNMIATINKLEVE